MAEILQEISITELFKESFEKLKSYYPESTLIEKLENDFYRQSKVFENALKVAPDRCEKLYVLNKQSLWLHKNICKIQALIDSAELRR